MKLRETPETGIDHRKELYNNRSIYREIEKVFWMQYTAKTSNITKYFCLVSSVDILKGQLFCFSRHIMLFWSTIKKIKGCSMKRKLRNLESAAQRRSSMQPNGSHRRLTDSSDMHKRVKATLLVCF